MTADTEFIEDLAADLGSQVYLDIAKWHLYLNDAKLHTLLAEKLYGLLQDNRLSEDAVDSILQTFPVTVGGGRNEIPLANLIPLQCRADLMEILEEKQKQL